MQEYTLVKVMRLDNSQDIIQAILQQDRDLGRDWRRGMPLMPEPINKGVFVLEPYEPAIVYQQEVGAKIVNKFETRKNPIVIVHGNIKGFKC